MDDYILRPLKLVDKEKPNDPPFIINGQTFNFSRLSLISDEPSKKATPIKIKKVKESDPVEEKESNSPNEIEKLTEKIEQEELENQKLKEQLRSDLEIQRQERREKMKEREERLLSERIKIQARREENKRKQKERLFSEQVRQSYQSPVSPSPRVVDSYSATPSPRSRQNSVKKTELVVKSPRLTKHIQPLKIISDKKTLIPKVKSKIEYTEEDSTPYMPMIPNKPQILTLPVNHELEELRREEEVIDMIEEIKKLEKQYPEMGIKIPKHTDNYQLIKEKRNMYTKKITIKQKVKDYQVYILIGAGILELLGTFVLGVDVDEFTAEQYKLLNKYEQDLENYAKTNYGGLLDDKPSEYKIIFTMFGYYFMMIIVKFILSKLPMAGMKDSISETIWYLMRGNDIGNKAIGPIGETSPAAKLVGDLAGYFPMLKMFMGGGKEAPTEKKVEVPKFDD